MRSPIPFELDGRPVEALAGESLLQVARRLGIAIPHLCHKEGLRPEGNCRACMVEIEGERVLAASCSRMPAPGMKVRTAGERARAAQRMVLELLRADVPEGCEKPDSELAAWCRVLGVGESRFAPRPAVPADRSHPGIAVDLSACIQCTRCLRACREIQVNDVIGFAGRGAAARIVFDVEAALGSSSCVACGECVQACPTGALMPAAPQSGETAAADAAVRAVDSLCPYCGVGCQVRYEVTGQGADARILRATGRDGPANGGRLCVKGRFGFDYPRHPHRLTRPLIRRPGVAKDMNVDPADPSPVFREASWEEALDAAAAGLARIRDHQGPHALAGFGSAKGSNEEAYLFQKLVRLGFGTHNVDHCTRLCHASSVAALLEGLGSGAVSNPVRDAEYADVILVIGANPAANHPVAASFLKNAAERGAALVLADPRATPLARHARHVLQFRPGADVALLLAMAATIIEEGLTDPAFIAARTEGFDEFRAEALRHPPERMEALCGIPAATIREVARLYAKGPNSIVFWGMGVSQHTHGTDNVRCLIALCLMTGQIGRPGTGLHPLRGQNNVQGASDAGLIPMMLPDYQRVSDPAARARFEALWGAPLSDRPGLTVVEILHAARAGAIRGMYILGENPAMSDPDLSHARAGLANLEHLVVQDLFLTETAMFADVILPASAFVEKAGSFTNTDRLVQMGRPALPLPGEARQDLDIIQGIARRLGLPWDYAGPAAVYEEMRAAMPSIAGISWAMLEAQDGVVYPRRTEEGPSRPVIFTEAFPTASGRGRFVPVAPRLADELPDADYPFVLITGRQLEHWHTGTMTRRSEVLDTLEPEAWCSLHPDDLAGLGGGVVRLETRRGRIELAARPDPGVPRQAVFLPFCYAEAAANLLTNPALDPYGKIPEFKFCAVRVTPPR